MRRKLFKTMFSVALAVCLMVNTVSASELGITETVECGELIPLETGISNSYNVYQESLDLSEEAVYNRMIAKKTEYPEGMSWTNANYYAWNGGIYSGGYGCAGFAFILSDAAFGNLPARILSDKSFSQIRTGDILRVNNDGHSVVVLEVYSSYVVIAEGNYNSSIHWGRILTKENLESGTLTYIMTRYPSDPGTQKVEDIFDDVDTGAWYVSAVQYAYDNGIMTGKTAATFAPNDNLTRAEFATVLYSQAGKPTVTYQLVFQDVARGAWYTSSVLWAYDNGIVSGYANGSFGTSDKITREQLALMMYKYAQTKGYDTTVDDSILSSFSDEAAISSWARKAIQWATSHGIMSGKGKGADGKPMLDPKGNATRAECAAMIKKLFTME